ncbi:MAG: hypothetical protein R3Y09_13095 [Clostridia bacterium]
MSFEQVLDVFADYIYEDTECEIFVSRYGYTVMLWDERGKEWSSVEHCTTPIELKNELLKSYEAFIDWQLTKHRDTQEEKDKRGIELAIERRLKQFEKYQTVDS